MIWSAAVIVLLAGLALVLRDVGRCIREPVLAQPVVIFESDDWRPAGEADARCLERIVELLAGIADNKGRHPCFTLGLILSTPDRSTSRKKGHYHRCTFADSEMKLIREAIAAGVAKGVFAVQLHGMEHFWPPALLAAARKDAAVQRWLDSPESRDPEDLPAPLQSRWTNAAVLPSRSHGREEIEYAVNEEVVLFRKLFGKTPEVFVPPTFVWNDDVESALAAAGVHTIVTPGRRFVGRDPHGDLIADHNNYRNGDRTAAGLTAIVRDIYFEPAEGHEVAPVVERIGEYAKRGRPALVETHRFNYTGDNNGRYGSTDKLSALLSEITATLPSVCFVSTEDLAESYANRDSGTVRFESSWIVNLRIRLLRLWDVSRIRKVIILVAAAELFFVGSALLNSGNQVVTGYG